MYSVIGSVSRTSQLFIARVHQGQTFFDPHGMPASISEEINKPAVVSPLFVVDAGNDTGALLPCTAPW